MSTRETTVYDPEVTILKWSSSLARRRPKTFIVGILAVLLGLVAVYYSFGGQMGPLVIAVLLLGGALGPLYLPTVFIFTDRKAYQQVFFSKDGYRWQDFDEYRVFNDGVFLHLRPTDLRMRYLKGLMVFYGASNGPEVLDVVRGHIVAKSPEASSTEVQQGMPDKK